MSLKVCAPKAHGEIREKVIYLLLQIEALMFFLPLDTQSQTQSEGNFKPKQERA